MDANDTQQQDSTPAPRKLLRSREDRLIGGVCGGLGRYFNVDPILFRIGIAVLALVGGAGLLLYLAGLLLIPSEPAVPGAEPTGGGRSVPVVVGVVVLLIVAWPFLLGGGVIAAAVLVPISALAIAGVLVWWLVSGEGPSGEPKDIALRAALGLGILILSFAVALGAAIAAAAGGGTIVAIALILAGLVIAAGAFVRPVRWLILPAVLMALSDRQRRRRRHLARRRGRRAALPPGLHGRPARPLRAGHGRARHRPPRPRAAPGRHAARDRPGHRRRADRRCPPTCAWPAAPTSAWARRTCSARTNGGVDVSFEEHPEAPPTASRLVLDADIGIGAHAGSRRQRSSVRLRRLQPRVRQPRPRARQRCQQRVPGARAMR